MINSFHCLLNSREDGKLKSHNYTASIRVSFLLLVNFYMNSMESMLTSCVTVGCARKALHLVVKPAQHIVGTTLPQLDGICTSRLRKRASSIATDPTHPSCWNHCRLGDLCRTRSHTHKLKNSFFPRAVASPKLPQTHYNCILKST